MQPVAKHSEYTLREVRPGTFSGFHPEMALRTEFERGRVAVVPENAIVADGNGVTGDTKPIELSATAWGCEGAMSEIPDSDPVPRDAGAGVSYRHAHFDEWYILTAEGLEQGFTIRELPDCARRTGKLKIRLRFSDRDGSIAQSVDGGREVILTTPGTRAVHYGKSRAHDAAGKEYAVRIDTDTVLALELEVADATLPLTVDPLIWDAQQKIVPGDFKPASFRGNDYFGRVLAVSGDTVVIGADGDDDLGYESGAAYVFVHEPPSAPGLRARWRPRQKLEASDAATGAHFGSAVALSGNFALIGATAANGRGAVYVFVRNGGTWTQQQKLVPSDLNPGADFGAAIALDGNNAIIGAPRQRGDSGVELGAAYAFARSNAWNQVSQFGPAETDSAGALHFGAAVALLGDVAAVGRDSVSGGGVDWYDRAGAAWGSAGVGVRSNIAHFGSALALNASRTAIGAPGDASQGVNAGAVYLTSTGSPHTPLVQLLARDGRVGDLFGSSLAVSGDTWLIGAPSVDGVQGGGSACSSVPDTGAAYVFGLNGSVWTQQKKLGPVGLGAHSPPSPPCDPGVAFGTAVAAADQVALLGAPSHTDLGAGFPNVGAVYEYEAALTNASPCAQDRDCFSAHCVEGVCCNAACNGPCLSCVAALKDPAHGFNGDWVTGICGEITADTDPKNGCNDMGTVCGTTGECSGYGSCKAANPPGTACGSGASSICLNEHSAAVNSQCVNYTCASFLSYDCSAGYLCKSGSCLSGCKNNSDCDAALGFVCKSGACRLGSTLGEACSKSNECPGGHCVDGVCCESSCDAHCVSCALLGNEGTCLPTTDDPGDALGACLAEGGSAGDAGATGRGSSGEAGALGEGGEAGNSMAGAGGSLGTGASGSRGEAENAGRAGQEEIDIECVPACIPGMICNRRTGICQDRFVMACGCRQVGGGVTPLPQLGWLLLLAVGAVRRGQARRTVRT